MSSPRLFFAVVLMSLISVAQQPAPADTTADKTEAQQNASDAPSAEKKPSRAQRVKKHLKDHFSTGCVAVAGCWDTRGPESPEAAQAQTSQSRERTPAPARDAGESSSRDTQISLDPPAGETGPELSGDAPVTEMTKWNPHKAAKNIEVADYYFKQKNYRAAESRYREALEWKSNDAAATWGLAQSLEHLGRKDEARAQYASYLKILPNGSKAAECRAALERLK